MARPPLPLDGLDLNLLVTLRALLREESVTLAAARLGQTQPTVSRALAVLRTAFDDPLLVRAGRGMALTPLARSLRTPVERSLTAIDRLSAVGSFEPASAQRTFRLIVPDIVGTIIIPPLAAALSQQAPHLTLQLLGSEKDALRMMLADEVDLVIGAPMIAHPELYTRRIGPDALGWSVLCGPQHPCWGGPVSLQDWIGTPHVQVTPGNRPSAGGPLDDALEARGLTREIRLYVGYLTAIGPILARTPYLSSLPTLVAQQLAALHGLQCTPHPLEGLPRLGVRMSWHQIHHADPGHAWLRDRLAESFAAA